MSGTYYIGLMSGKGAGEDFYAVQGHQFTDGRAHLEEAPITHTVLEKLLHLLVGDGGMIAVGILVIVEAHHERLVPAACDNVVDILLRPSQENEVPEVFVGDGLCHDRPLPAPYHDLRRYGVRFSLTEEMIWIKRLQQILSLTETAGVLDVQPPLEPAHVKMGQYVPLAGCGRWG